MTGREGRCPDAGICHHDCPERSCYRVGASGPLSGVFPNDEWPAWVVSDIEVHQPKDEPHTLAETFALAADEDMFEFSREERVTMTLDPSTFYTEQAALAALVGWVERVQRSSLNVPPGLRTLFDLGADLKALYSSQEVM